MQIINIWWHSKKGGKFKSGGAIWIRMCEYNFKNPIWGIKKGGKNKKEYELILKNVSVEFEFALRVEDTKECRLKK